LIEPNYDSRSGCSRARACFHPTAESSRWRDSLGCGCPILHSTYREGWDVIRPPSHVILTRRARISVVALRPSREGAIYQPRSFKQTTPPHTVRVPHPSPHHREGWDLIPPSSHVILTRRVRISVVALRPSREAGINRPRSFKQTTPPSTARVPHPSQHHREGWDVISPPSHVAAPAPHRSGAPSFTAPS
jgi:hypothetical protein